VLGRTHCFSLSTSPDFKLSEEMDTYRQLDSSIPIHPPHTPGPPSGTPGAPPSGFYGVEMHSDIISNINISNRFLSSSSLNVNNSNILTPQWGNSDDSPYTPFSFAPNSTLFSPPPLLFFSPLSSIIIPPLPSHLSFSDYLFTNNFLEEHKDQADSQDMQTQEQERVSITTPAPVPGGSGQAPASPASPASPSSFNLPSGPAIRRKPRHYKIWQAIRSWRQAGRSEAEIEAMTVYFNNYISKKRLIKLPTLELRSSSMPQRTYIKNPSMIGPLKISTRNSRRTPASVRRRNLRYAERRILFGQEKRATMARVKGV